MLLSDARQGAERAEKVYQDISQLAQDLQIKEAMDARAFVSGKVLATLDECFRLIGEQAVKFTGRLQETFLKDFRNELGEIQSPVVRRIYILAKLNHLVHLQIGELIGLIAASEAAGHYGVGLLLETCLADKLTFIERSA